MAKTDYPGIDYGMGQANVDPETGIRYGVISAHDLTQWLWEEVESVYVAHCPSCGEELPEDDSEYQNDDDSANYAERNNLRCPSCKATFGDDDRWGDEPDAQIIDKDGIQGHVSSDMDVWVTKSPYYTRAQFCSPCAPGAGHLGSPCDEGPKTYCFGHDWFDGDKAPYDVFRVDDDSPVLP